MNNNKRETLSAVLGVIGIVFISYTIISALQNIGKTSEPSEFTLLSFFKVFLVLMAWHWAIEWIKEMFDA